MSSSCRAAVECDGVLVRDGVESGPLRLPGNRAKDFVDHFNRTYESVGLRIETRDKKSDSAEVVDDCADAKRNSPDK